MSKRREYIGEVVSDKMQKTIAVRVMRMAKHAKYGRIIRKYNTFKAHDENKVAKMGDKVRIVETRPLSKNKRFRMVEVVKKELAPQLELKEEIK
ncbi:MAG: 30S ribosomal protein S17 [Candidatus Omnitrophota bacterium]